MNPAERALDLIDLVYAAVHNRDGWTDVAKALSELLSGAAVSVIAPTLGSLPSETVFRVGFKDEYNAAVQRFSIDFMPRVLTVGNEISERLIRLDDYFPDLVYPGCEMDVEYLEPQGFAPEGPILSVLAPDLAPLSPAIVVWRLRDGPPVTDAQIEIADRVIPHVARALEFQSALGGSESAQLALAEVIDRIPTGVFVLDRKRKPLIVNRMGHRILESRDGFGLDADGPIGADADATKALRKLIDTAVTPLPGREFAGGGFMALKRPSGLRGYPVLVTPILGKSPHGTADEAAALVFISDPEFREITITDVLISVYELTPAEAELAQLLAQGNSLEEAAAARGVTLNTARSQLKQVFAKTDTNRQGQLLQLVLSGVATIEMKGDAVAER